MRNVGRLNESGQLCVDVGDGSGAAGGVTRYSRLSERSCGTVAATQSPSVAVYYAREMRLSYAVCQLMSSSLSSQLLLLLLMSVLVDRGRTSPSVVADGRAFYTDRWAVQVRGGEDVARRLAADHGFEFVAKVRPS